VSRGALLGEPPVYSFCTVRLLLSRRGGDGPARCPTPERFGAAVVVAAAEDVDRRAFWGVLTGELSPYANDQGHRHPSVHVRCPAGGHAYLVLECWVLDLQT
jgi:hypothetical protein